MTPLISNFPARQKFLLILVIGGGFIIWLCSTTNIFSTDTINKIIFFYSFGMPFLFLGFSTLIDLNDNKVFIVWIILATILLLISIATKNSNKFLIHRSVQFDRTSGVNSQMNDHSTASLKSLFVFLIMYWFLNLFSKKVTGNFIVNTLRQIPGLMNMQKEG